MSSEVLSVRLRNREVIARRVAAVRAAKEKKAREDGSSDGLTHEELDVALAGVPEPEWGADLRPTTCPPRRRKRYVPIDHPEQPCEICSKIYKPKNVCQKCCGPTCQAELALLRGVEYRARPEVRARRQKYSKSEASRESKNRYQARPEVRARRRAERRRRDSEARIQERIAED